MRELILVSVGTLCCSLALNSATAQPTPPCCALLAAQPVKAAPAPVGIEQVAFLAGDWSAHRPARNGAQDFTQEVWSAPAGNNMIGMFRWVGADGASRVFELLTITEEDDTLVLRLRHQDAQGNAWEEQAKPATLHLARLVSADPDSHTPSIATFQDTAGSCDLAACEYDASTPGQLTITVRFDDTARQHLVFTLAGAHAATAPTTGAALVPASTTPAGGSISGGRKNAPGESSALTPDQAQAVFDRFASMDGEWIGRSTKGWEERIAYQTVAGGSVVVERSFDAHPGEQMYTMVHMDNDRLMLTHYCVARNQPRLVCTAWDEATSAATFEFLDATNLDTRDQGHMDKVIIRFLDDAHVTSHWTWYQDGVESWMEEIVMERTGEP